MPPEFSTELLTAAVLILTSTMAKMWRRASLLLRLASRRAIRWRALGWEWRSPVAVRKALCFQHSRPADKRHFFPITAMFWRKAGGSATRHRHISTMGHWGDRKSVV